MKKALLFTFVSAMLLSFTQSVQALEVVVAISAPPGSTQYITAEEFTRRANEELGDKAKVTFFGAAQLGKDKDLMQKLKLGTVHLSMPSSIMSSIAGASVTFTPSLKKVEAESSFKAVVR